MSVPGWLMLAVKIIDTVIDLLPVSEREQGAQQLRCVLDERCRRESEARVRRAQGD